jgi:hypothetical protein
MKVNLVELCTHFAQIATEAYAEGGNEICAKVYDEETDTYSWAKEYQKIFDNFYDEYWDIMIQYGFKHENK